MQSRLAGDAETYAARRTNCVDGARAAPSSPSADAVVNGDRPMARAEAEATLRELLASSTSLRERRRGVRARGAAAAPRSSASTRCRSSVDLPARSGERRERELFVLRPDGAEQEARVARLPLLPAHLDRGGEADLRATNPFMSAAEAAADLRPRRRRSSCTRRASARSTGASPRRTGCSKLLSRPADRRRGRQRAKRARAESALTLKAQTLAELSMLTRRHYVDGAAGAGSRTTRASCSSSSRTTSCCARRRWSSCASLSARCVRGDAAGQADADGRRQDDRRGAAARADARRRRDARRADDAARAARAVEGDAARDLLVDRAQARLHALVRPLVRDALGDGRQAALGGAQPRRRAVHRVDDQVAPAQAAREDGRAARHAAQAAPEHGARRARARAGAQASSAAACLIMDEVDLLLHPLKSELNFPIGEKHPLDLSPERWTCAIHALDAVFYVERKAMSVPFHQSGRAHAHPRRAASASSRTATSARAAALAAPRAAQRRVVPRRCGR